MGGSETADTVEGNPQSWGGLIGPWIEGTRDVVADPAVAEGASLRLHDPQAICGFKRHHPEAPPRLTYFDAPEGAACSVDALMILTDWAEYAKVDLALIREKMFVPLILDGRNLLEPDAVRKLGIEYYSIGRP